MMTAVRLLSEGFIRMPGDSLNENLLGVHEASRAEGVATDHGAGNNHEVQLLP